MAEGVINGTSSEVLSAYNYLISSLNPAVGRFVNLFVVVLLILLYSMFVWKIHKIVSRKDFLKLNLHERAEETGKVTRFSSAALYFLEYLVISPFLIFFWFMAFAFFLIIFTEGLSITSILVVSAATVSAIRMTSYYNESLSRELAKLLPFNLLAASLILGQDFFSVERIISQIQEIPTLKNVILSYLIFIIIIEAVLRFFDFTFSIFGIEEEGEEIETEITD